MPKPINMGMVIVLDFMLDIADTETQLPVKLQKVFEIYAHVPGNMAVAFLGSSAGYTQLKFNGFNHGVTGDNKDRHAGRIFAYAMLCGFFLFTPNAIELLEVRAAIRGARSSRAS